MHWNRLLTMLVSLSMIAVATLGAQAQPDGRGQPEGRGAGEGDHHLLGAFNASRTDADLEDFHQTVSNVTDDYAIMESFPEQFAIHDLSRAECGSLRDNLSEKPYLTRLSECQHEDDDDADDNGTRRGPPAHARDRAAAQGRALGLDGEWHECRTAAGDNETLKKECHDAAMERAIERHEAIRAARANGTVGGELNITRGRPHQIDNATGVNITALTADETSDADAPELRVEVSAEMDRGQTIVLDVDPEMFDADGILLIKYYDVAEDGTETENTSFSQADSLEDVLDPDDDEGPEYWIVEDHEGLHVMVSIPTWSTHAITMSSAPSESAAIPAAPVSLLLAAFAALAIAVRRRAGKQD